MFAERLLCSWIGVLGLAAGAFCQTYVQIAVDGEATPSSINKRARSQDLTLTPQGIPMDLCVTPAERLRFSTCREAL